METIVNAAATLCSSPNCFFQLKPTYKQPLKVPAVCCLRKNEKGNGLISGPSPIELEDNNNVEMHQDSFQSSNRGLEINRSDIWNLFREAQRNILYLNKQRLMAIEELKQTQQEKQLLLNRMEQLGGGKQSRIGKGPLTKSDKQSICSELLLRIDSMVLTGMIDTGEASVLRRLVIDNKVSIVEVFSEIRQKGDAELLAGFGQFKDKSNRDRFHIVHICTEMEPVASVGSLASYVTSLSHALQRKGNLVEVILPKYASMNLNEIEALQNIEAEFHSYFNGHWHGNRIWTGVVNGIGVTFIEPLYYSAFFNREAIYGYSDDFERFTYFSRASLDYIVKSGKQPDVLHIHNWETAIVGPLFWDIFVKKGLSGTRILFTCHGFSSQCLEHPNKLALCGLDPSQLHRPDRLQDNIKKDLVNILKGGVVYSNKVIMMSSIHSKGKIIRNLSHGLESTLAIHKEKLSIAPYGFDGNIWDPSKDKFLPANYSAEDIKGKTICKVALLQRLGLSGQAGTVVVGCIYTKVSDTDLENLKAAVWLGSKKGAQFIFMGAGEIPSINAALESFQKELKDESVRFINKYDEALSHLILAGSDIFLCPSFHDPVLQMPLKAIKYGAAPVAITLTDDGFRHAMEHDFEGTRSSQYIISAFGNMSLSQALGQINKDPTHWNQKIRDGMAKDFSWDAECRDVHLEAYTSIKNL